MDYQIDFNPAPPTIMHVDLNSCFASVEQQANPLLRHKPVAVVASDAPYGAILAPSVEAKLWGVKTGMSLAEGRLLCPWLISRLADPPKYREVHQQFKQLLDQYSPSVAAKSIDEFVFELQGLNPCSQIGKNIKSQIKTEIGDYLRVNIGVSTNQVLAKLGAGLHKPDGFDIIDHSNYLSTYNSIQLTDFCGINIANEARLHRVGIFTPLQFFQASIATLESAFGGILGRYWHTRLRGYEIDDKEFSRRSFGQSYVLPRPMEIKEWQPILAKLIAKASRRLRAGGYSASGVHLSLRFDDHTSWHAGHKAKTLIFDDASLLTAAINLYYDRVTAKLEERSVKKISFTCFGLAKENNQLSCLVDIKKQRSLINSLDEINDKWGEYTLSYASTMGSIGHVRDAIAFGK